MGFDLKDAEDEGRRKWFAKLKKRDPGHARLFCQRCFVYLGAARTCDCEAGS